MSSAASYDLDAITAPAAEVERYLATFIAARPFPANLTDAIEYAAMGPGKRLRPVLAVRACEAVGGEPDAAFPPAAAIELIHCFSLVHDDLPAMDDDDLRRGRPTLHKKTNDAMAILAGDAMNTLAFELLATNVSDAELAVRLVGELSIATNDMIAGQVYDTLPAFDESLAPIDRLKLIHRHKTGALIRCACRMGALAAGASDDELNAMTTYAEAVGLMFQVVDDLLDVTASTEDLGKTAGKDVEQGKLTYPALLGLDATRDVVEKLRQDAIDALGSFDHRAQPLRDLCEYMAVRKR